VQSKTQELTRDKDIKTKGNICVSVFIFKY